MNPVLRAVFFVMLMRAAEHFVDYLGARLRSGGGFVYELAILPPEAAGVCRPAADDQPETERGSWVTRTWAEAGPADEGPTPTRLVIVPESFPSYVTLHSPAESGEIIEVCGVMFEIDTLIHAEGRCDRLLLAPISLDVIPLGRPQPGRVARAWAWLSGYIDGLIGGMS